MIIFIQKLLRILLHDFSNKEKSQSKIIIAIDYFTVKSMQMVSCPKHTIRDRPKIRFRPKI